MKKRSKLVTGYIFIYLTIAWVFLASFIPHIMRFFEWGYWILFFIGIGELNSYRRVKKRKRFRVGEEEAKYIKWLFVELGVGIIVLTVKCILESMA